ncbi:MAG TPA: endonuclease/exonuclease/phosphatase family protein [Bryobacteraceae bacterium]|nr:endonuclease/exonuclease/phosphatase family protein [Bryobacteraceae bacterium]
MRIVYAARILYCSVLLLQTARTLPSADLDTPRLVQLPSAGASRSSFGIVSWNIDRGKELPRITAELERQRPGLCLLQEVDWNTRRTDYADVPGTLAGALHLNMAYGIEFEELSQERKGESAYIGQATLTRLPIRNARVLRFKTQSGFWKPRAWLPSSPPFMQRRAGGRIALVTELEFQGGLWVVYNAHLESRSYGRIQEKQLHEILNDANRYGPSTSVIIGGDLNTKYFPSIYLKKLEREGFHSALGERIERTHTIAMALDWIFVRGPIKIERGQVRRDMKGSDHFAVYADLAPDAAAQARRQPHATQP